MSISTGVADLHMHTTASDGTSTVKERVKQAEERNLKAIAITDHDTVSDELGAGSEMRAGVELITGVEVRADLFDTKIEILGYFIDPDNEKLEYVLETAREYRHQRNEKMVANLNEVTGLRLSLQQLRDEVDGELGRPHLAERLVSEGLADSIGDAFDDYLGKDGDVYVPMERVPYDEVLDAIHSAGEVASLAHPGRISSDRVPEMVEELAEAGIDAIEVWYPYGGIKSDRHADIGVEGAEQLAEEHGLVKTGGSDCHGPDSGKFRIGEVRVPREEFEKLKELAE
ncbi:MAG: PHP domain-containing protein [Halobacteria archaeon]|nr:PHP domain-containing protein [Halobacteria archaeon]